LEQKPEPAFLSSLFLFTPDPLLNVEGFARLMSTNHPDPSVHKLCMRCRRWFDADDGEMIIPEPTGPISKLRLAAATIAGDDSACRFMCHRCLRTRRRTKAVIWLAIAVAIGAAFLVAWLRGEL
jgi:hypothetical protein